MYKKKTNIIWNEKCTFIIINHPKADQIKNSSLIKVCAFKLGTKS